ncbi:MAG: ribbon-helix-helix protein, CopG family [Deltaproteobacteria bacterium]|nr:ribbon-helix-helix protein, CopG family [Deltaproteobacteria bacterium]
MKTAVSVPDEVFEQAERCAKRLGISRSELVTRALRRFLEDEQAAAIKASYDAAFSESTDDDLAAARRRAARDTLRKVEW